MQSGKGWMEYLWVFSWGSSPEQSCPRQRPFSLVRIHLPVSHLMPENAPGLANHISQTWNRKIIFKVKLRDIQLMGAMCYTSSLHSDYPIYFFNFLFMLTIPRDINNPNMFWTLGILSSSASLGHIKSLQEFIILLFLLLRTSFV